jgi:hypothetical protein
MKLSIFVLLVAPLLLIGACQDSADPTGDGTAAAAGQL